MLIMGRVRQAAVTFVVRPLRNCVEIAHLPDGQVAIRNSRHATGPALVFTPGEWAAFVDGAKDGDFD